MQQDCKTQNKMKVRNVLLTGLLASGVLLSSCGDDDVPVAENEEEIIDLVTLTFTPSGGGTAIVAKAEDPDGEGDLNFVLDDIALSTSTTYTLAITLENTEEGEDITQEIATEADEHMFFFGFTTDIFSNPAGNGNVDSRIDDVNYEDSDGDNPIGLSTTWTTSSSSSTDGEFQVILKHQPEIKSATSTSSDGESDIDITWTINISNPI